MEKLSASTEYFKNQGLFKYIEITQEISLDAYQAIDPKNTTPFSPDIEDLVRLHRIVRERRVLTILEFGVGFSTLVMADALAKNQMEFGCELQRKDIRCLNPFKIFCVDADVEWVRIAKERIPSSLIDFISFSISEVHIGTFNDRICHYFDKLPNITPDFIYLDAPANSQIRGDINGLDFATNYERTVMSGDLLRLEPTLTPGTMILIDGRVNNARFLKNNFQRRWKMMHDAEADVTTFELIESPLGVHNHKRLGFQRLLRNMAFTE